MRGGAERDESDASAKVLASTRGISGAMGKQLAFLGSDMAAGLGQTVDATVKELTALVTEGYPAIKKLQEGIGFLTAEEMEAVRAAADHGEQAKALGIALDALHRRFDGLRDQSLSPAGKALHQLGVGWNAFMDAVATSRPVMDAITGVSGAVVRMANAVTSPPQQQIGELKSDLDELYRRREARDKARAGGKSYIGIFSIWDLFGATDGSDLDRQIKSVEERLTAAQRRVVDAAGNGRVAGTFAGASSYGGKVDQRSGDYVDDQTASYERMAKALALVGPARDLAIAGIRAEDEARDKNIKGADRERLIALRTTEALSSLAVQQNEVTSNSTVPADIANSDDVVAIFEEMLS